MKRNVVCIMVVILGVLLVFNTSGHCGSDMRASDMRPISSDPHDVGVGIAVSVRRNIVETLYIIGDPHKNSDMALTRKSKIVGTTYIKGDPHNNESSDVAVPVVRRPVMMNYISGDPH